MPVKILEKTFPIFQILQNLLVLLRSFQIHVFTHPFRFPVCRCLETEFIGYGILDSFTGNIRNGMSIKDTPCIKRSAHTG